MKFSPRRREISLKVVYYGPGLSGKTTNLRALHGQAPQDARGDLVQLDTETERTLFFDYFPLSLGTANGYRVKVDFFTVPGQSFYARTRRAVLEGADGVVFVADSSARREHANLLSKTDLVESLEAKGRPLSRLPLVYQWNKRDLADALPVKTLERLLNVEGAPSFSAVASTGEGVADTQQAIVERVLSRLRERVGTRRPHVH